MLREPTSERQFILYEALRKGASVEELYRLTHIKPWFLEQMKELVELEEEILTHRGRRLPDALLRQAKKDGFADRYLARLIGTTEGAIREQRKAIGVVEAWDAVPVSGVENAAYYYSTYNGADKVPVSTKRKVMILGGGPNRIGQGIEFDYCCVHAAFALRDLGFETIMVNCNPETVSTDYDTSDKLYFEPLTVEDVLSIYEKEKPEGVIVQFGGQTPLNIAAELEKAGVRILGTTVETIDLAEDRDLFRQAMERHRASPCRRPAWRAASTRLSQIAERIGYPLMVRPSFVLGGRGMEVVHDEEMLRDYVAKAVEVTPEHPILIDRFLANAIECEADAISDGEDVFVPGGDGAHRVRGRPLGRLGLRDPARQHLGEAHRRDRGRHATHRPRARRRRPDEHPVRHRERQALRPRGEPAGLADRAARLQGLQHLDGAHRHRADAGQEASAT